MKGGIKHAIVKTVINGMQISRYGRGYSKNELVQTGVTDIRIARKKNIQIDPFRTTSYEENIEKLKAFLSQKTSEPNSTKHTKSRKRTKQDS